MWPDPRIVLACLWAGMIGSFATMAVVFELNAAPSARPAAPAPTEVSSLVHEIAHIAQGVK